MGLGERSTTMEGKGKRMYKKVKYQLVEYVSLPGYLKDNEFIQGYYRAQWPLKQTLLSIFSIHNETLNVLTHLIGFFLFLSLTIYTATKVPNVVDLHSLSLLDMHAGILRCLPSLPNMADLHDVLPSLSGF
ncbi:hypothetical protein Droror1_Dr00026342 [Drosera rotundifolia]